LKIYIIRRTSEHASLGVRDACVFPLFFYLLNIKNIQYTIYSCVFHDGHYFKDLSLVDEDPRRVVLVDNNPASFVLCPANGIPVTSFYDDPYGKWESEREILREMLDK
jgi:TFIIF-interacting CTD phosphatase-like protein